MAGRISAGLKRKRNFLGQVTFQNVYKLKFLTDVTMDSSVNKRCASCRFSNFCFYIDFENRYLNKTPTFGGNHV